MTLEIEIAELKTLIEAAIQDRKDALAEIAVLTQDDPTNSAQDILELARDAYEYLVEARQAKAKLKALRESIKPSCTCGCHQ
jgi:hypothetical protein